MRILLSFLLVIAFSNLNAQEFVTDRPDQTESSSTVAKSSLQIESGVLVQHNGKEQKETLLPTTLFRYGLLKGFELRIQHEYAKLKYSENESIYGFNDIHLGFKAQLFKKESSNTEIAWISHLVFPSGNEEFSNTDHGVVNKLSIAHQLNPKTSIGYNVGYDYFGVSILTYSLALGSSINDNTGLYIETFGDYEDFDTFNINLDAGITYLVRKNLQLDFSFGTGLNTDMNYIALGFSWYILPNKN